MVVFPLLGQYTVAPLLKRLLLSLSQWFSLSDVKSGRVHLVLEWVPTASEPERLDQVWSSQIRPRTHSHNSDGLMHSDLMTDSFLFRFFSSILDSLTKTRQFPLQAYCLSLLSKQMDYQ